MPEEGAWTPWETVWTPAALRDLRRLDRPVRERAHEAITRFAASGRGALKHLSGAPEEWRLAVGDWRVRFAYDAAAHTLVVLRVLHRREARDR